MATALITGASGLIGRALLTRWDVAGVDAVPVRHRDSDLLRPGAAVDLITRARPDVVVHLAWCASGTPRYRTSTDNAAWVAATLELWDACRAAGTHLVATGTVLDAGAGAHAADAYTRAKSRLRAALGGHRQLTWLRPHYVFSPADRRPRLVADVLAGEPLGTPRAAHDFVHVDDVARAIVDVVRHRLAGPVDIGSGCLRTVAGLARALGADLPDEIAESGTVADIEPLRRLGWSPTTTTEFFSMQRIP